ncbi:MAG: nucleoside-binding protein [Bacteroidota bacterium]
MKYMPFALLAMLANLPGQAQSADFSDTVVAYRYGSQFTEPAIAHDIAKNILTVNHLASGWTGLHILSLEGRYSDHYDPAKNSSDGASEYLFNYRYQLAAGRLLDQPLAVGPVRDFALLAGIDLTTKDTLFAPRKRAWMFGPVVKFAVPGFLDIGLLYYKERNHKGIPLTPHPDTEFAGTWMLSATWGIPFEMASRGMIFQGLFNRIGEKGSDFNDRPTVGETLLRTSLMTDVGQTLGLAAPQLRVGVGYEWWKNKYGTPSGVGTHTRTPTLNLEAHF